MKRYLAMLMIAFCCFSVVPVHQAKAAIPIVWLIKQAVIKIIKAFDLMVQRIQNKTIWLQNAQKVLENKLSQLKLTDIAKWTGRQRDLYKKYYDDLWKIRKALADMNRIRLITNRQMQLVAEYKRTWSMVNNDKHFTKSEIDYMYRVYMGILDDSINNLEQLTLIISSYQTQMSDAKRLSIINTAGDGIDKNYSDLQQFNNQNMQLSINRAKDQSEVDAIRKLYGIKTK